MAIGTPTIGILMLDTAFERFPGDVGNPSTWDFPIRYRIVKGASAAEATGDDPARLLAPFIASGLELIEAGAGAITTSCGFLAVHQRALSEALPVPVLSSALLQAPMIRALLPRSRFIGVLTFNAETLSSRHLAGAGIDFPVHIAGLPLTSAMRRDVLGGLPSRFETREAEVLAVAEGLLARHPDIGALLLECTNFPPHAPALRARFGLPVFDIVTAVNALYLALSSCETPRAMP